MTPSMSYSEVILTENPYRKIRSETNWQAFVYIITGEINSGKTGTLLSIYHNLCRGDGFINSKIFDSGVYIGQRIIRLSTGESECFSFKDRFIPSDWDEEYRYDVYSFSKKGMEFARRTAADIIEKGVDPVFIDEIGPLELQMKGFYDIFSEILRKRKKVFVTVRSSCFEKVTEYFGIRKYQIIKVKDQPAKKLPG
jgi:nucleoside-triphosphatase THEP1